MGLLRQIKRVVTALVPCLLALPLTADTVRFVKGTTVNGKVTYADEMFTIAATFTEGGTQTIEVERRYVERIVPNDNVDNSGALAADWGVFGAEDAEKLELGTADMVRLHGGARVRGRLERIDDSSIHINQKNIRRSDVLDIYLGSARILR